MRATVVPTISFPRKTNGVDCGYLDWMALEAARFYCAETIRPSDALAYMQNSRHRSAPYIMEISRLLSLEPYVVALQFDANGYVMLAATDGTTAIQLLVNYEDDAPVNHRLVLSSDGRPTFQLETYGRPDIMRELLAQTIDRHFAVTTT